jgi:hypothetical protein
MIARVPSAAIAEAGAAVRRLANGRAVAAAMVGGYFALVAALGGYTAWGRLGVPPTSNTHRRLWFGDLRSVTSAWDCVRRGLPIVPVNPCDPWQRPTIYPHVWLLPRHLGLGQGDTFALGLAIVGVFLLAALAVLPATAEARAGLLYGAALCSPAVMLGVQRGNVDILVFALVVLAVLVRANWFLRAAIVLFAAVLKLFPLFALGFVVRRPSRQRLLAAGLAAAAFAVYLLATWSTVHESLRVLPLGGDFTFGVRRVGDWLAALTRHHASPGAWRAVVLVGAVAVVLACRRRLRNDLAATDGDAGATRDLDLFWAGAWVYVGSYAFFTSWDYRLVFVLLTLPQLVRWAAARSRLAVAVLVALFATLWLDPAWSGVAVVGSLLETWSRATAHLASGHAPLRFVAVAQLALFIGLLAGLVATAPRLFPRRRTLRSDV